MKNFTTIDPSKLNENVIELIGREWMLVSAGSAEKFNMMTASWGSVGFYANKSIVTMFIRPERYTFDFIESSDHFTLSFFGEGHREALALLGKSSGRDGDKIAQTDLTPIFTDGGNPAFGEARLVLECRKLYGQMMCKEGFADQQEYDKWYNQSKGGIHKLYMGVIENCWIKEA